MKQLRYIGYKKIANTLAHNVDGVSMKEIRAMIKKSSKLTLSSGGWDSAAVFVFEFLLTLEEDFTKADIAEFIEKDVGILSMADYLKKFPSIKSIVDGKLLTEWGAGAANSIIRDILVEHANADLIVDGSGEYVVFLKPVEE